MDSFAGMGFLEFSQFAELRLLTERLGFDFIAGDAPGFDSGSMRSGQTSIRGG
jgi:hypothetical protein